MDRCLIEKSKKIKGQSQQHQSYEKRCWFFNENEEEEEMPPPFRKWTDLSNGKSNNTQTFVNRDTTDGSFYV